MTKESHGSAMWPWQILPADQDALITARSAVPAETKHAVAAIVGKYLG